MKVLKTALLIILSLFLSDGLSAKIIPDPTTWTLEAKKINADTYDLIFHLKLKKDWHIWSFHPGGDGLEIPPSFAFNPNKNVKLVDSIKEKGTIITKTEDGTDGDVHEFRNRVDYIQRVHATGDFKLSGVHTYQVCNESMCLPPKDKPFSFEIKDGVLVTDKKAADSTVAIANPDSTLATTQVDSAKKIAVAPAAKNNDNTTSNGNKNKSLLWLFLAALGGGLAAVLTPCVYSMIPITVSFFTKRSKTRAEGIRNAIYYSLSIIIIFTVLGVLISAVFGSNALNSLSTNWIANLFFFVVFIIFGVSFLGAFEITLPSSWTSKTDSKAGLSSFGGIFFMALTLVIVSFSCTGPIVGPLLVLAGRGGIAGPAVGMFGFSMGLALPFALFAIFPGMLNKIAASGGWLNQVKVVLGFIELMLAMKFLSNADLAMGWRLLDREIFIAIWIVLSVLLGIYLLGKLKLSHDDATPKNIYGQEYVSIFKLFLSIVAFTFAMYLVPGMWGAPLNGMSAFIPPIGTQDFISGGNGGGNNSSTSINNANSDVAPLKYVNEMRIYEPPVVKNLGLSTYFDYNEAMAASKKLKKPIMLDFTGINCVNCRKMESQVWSKPEVAKRLKEDFIVVSLYCDINRIELPKSEQYFSKDLNAQVTTLGNRNSDLEAAKFGSNAEPIYFYVDENGNKLVEDGYSYDPDVQKFIDHLEKVKANYRKTHN